jgi:ABC-2 type transport system permease protein
MTRERERGTMENLLATPVRPSEVMVGKILPYVVMGYIQLAVILLAAFALFQVPWKAACPADGHDRRLHHCQPGGGLHLFDDRRNQLQAMQMTFFFFLPSMLLSGFMFPFRAMPVWAQYVGEVLPLTHFLRIVRGILLKGNSAPQVLGELWPMLAFMTVVSVVALKRYRQTLD